MTIRLEGIGVCSGVITTSGGGVVRPRLGLSIVSISKSKLDC